MNCFRMEETDFCDNLDPAEYDMPPLCTFNITSPDSEFQVSISQKLQSNHLIDKLSSMLKIPPERLILCNTNDVEIHTAALTSLRCNQTH